MCANRIRRLLTSPSLAPFAPLCRAQTKEQRIELLRQALGVIRDVPDPQRAHVLANAAATFAEIRLEPATVDAVLAEAGFTRQELPEA